MLDGERMRVLLLLGFVACTDERGHVDVIARIDVSARDHASVDAYCSDMPCTGATVEVTVGAITSQLAGRRGDVAIPMGASEITLTWSDGVETVAATTAIPEPIVIAIPEADAVIARSGELDVAWVVARGDAFEVATDASCDTAGRGISARMWGSHLSSAQIDLAFFDALPPHDCFARLAVANLVEARGIAANTNLYLRTQDVDQIDYTLAYRDKPQ